VKCCAKLIVYSMKGHTHRCRNPTRQVTTSSIATSASAATANAHLPFFETYFSNFIEGTEFELDEAVAVVYEGKQIPGRADDSHDLLGTYRVVA